MYRISQLADAIAAIENLDKDQASVRQKQLRNLTQRLPFAPVGQEGRADLYPREALAALRIVQIADDIGLGRRELHDLTTRLFASDPLGEAEKVPGGLAQPSVIADMVHRAMEGEDFCLRASRTIDGQTLYDAGHPVSETAKAIFRSAGAEPKIAATLEFPAAELIRDLLNTLNPER